MWVFRWMAKVPGHFVTQQAVMLPRLWTLPELFVFFFFSLYLGRRGSQRAISLVAKRVL